MKYLEEKKCLLAQTYSLSYKHMQQYTQPYACTIPSRTWQHESKRPLTWMMWHSSYRCHAHDTRWKVMTWSPPSMTLESWDLDLTPVPQLRYPVERRNQSKITSHVYTCCSSSQWTWFSCPCCFHCQPQRQLKSLWTAAEILFPTFPPIYYDYYDDDDDYWYYIIPTPPSHPSCKSPSHPSCK